MPGITDRAALASYAKTVAEASYRALGDVPSSKGEDGPGNQAGNHLTIVLPRIIAEPRQERSVTIDRQGVTIDVTPSAPAVDRSSRPLDESPQPTDGQ